VRQANRQTTPQTPHPTKTPTRSQTTARRGLLVGLVISEVAARTSMTTAIASTTTITTMEKVLATRRSAVGHAASRAPMLTRRCRRTRSRHRHIFWGDERWLHTTWPARPERHINDYLECWLHGVIGCPWQKDADSLQHVCWPSITDRQNGPLFPFFVFLARCIMALSTQASHRRLQHTLPKDCIHEHRLISDSMQSYLHSQHPAPSSPHDL